MELVVVEKLVAPTGLEPVTPPMSWECATNCAKGRLLRKNEAGKYQALVQDSRLLTGVREPILNLRRRTHAFNWKVVVGRFDVVRYDSTKLVTDRRPRARFD